ncbi:MAG: hypothetical protein Q8O00_09925 [Holophaga sp.]|nr:hypothetical protein [Holophaga sp.]
MLHSLPAMLDDLERRLIAGEDPLPLLASVRWPSLGGWPQDPIEAQQLKHRISSISSLINGLQAPLQATLLALNQFAGYGAKGAVISPTSLSYRFSEHV